MLTYRLLAGLMMPYPLSCAYLMFYIIVMIILLMETARPAIADSYAPASAALSSQCFSNVAAARQAIALQPHSIPSQLGPQAPLNRSLSTPENSRNHSSKAAINLNTATAEQLALTLNGIGPVKAQAIVEYRTTHGRFQTVDDLTRVKGIGAATLTKNRDLLRLQD